jgi:hypothetical protein
MPFLLRRACAPNFPKFAHEPPGRKGRETSFSLGPGRNRAWIDGCPGIGRDRCLIAISWLTAFAISGGGRRDWNGIGGFPGASGGLAISCRNGIAIGASGGRARISGRRACICSRRARISGRRACISGRRARISGLRARTSRHEGNDDPVYEGAERRGGR